MEKPQILFIFIDGIGIGPSGIYNPFSTAAMDFFIQTTGTRLLGTPDISTDALLLKGIDACLGVSGLPQSATGQTTIFTGHNAAKLLGHHLPAFPNQTLIDLIDRESIFRKLSQWNLKATFANAYSPAFWELVSRNSRLLSVTTQCILTTGGTFRTIEDLKNGTAVYWDVTNEHLKKHTGIHLDKVDPWEAGKRLSSLSSSWDFVLFETFLTDLIGHSADMEEAVSILTTIDRFLSGIIQNKPDNTTVILTSDHGNMEDLSTGNHTLNPVPLFVSGPLAKHFIAANSITDITPLILKQLRNRDI